MALTPVEESQARQLLAVQASLLSLAGNESTITSKLGATKATLSDLSAATGVSDADIFLLRQGTTDKSVAGSLVKNFAGGLPVTQAEAEAGIIATLKSWSPVRVMQTARAAIGALVSQGTAEAGSDNGIVAWSALRVRQAAQAAIYAWQPQFVTQQDAEVGTSATTTWWSALRVRQAAVAAIAERVVNATELFRGITYISTYLDARAGTDTGGFISPYVLKLGFSIQIGQNGYIVFPDWMGKIIFQWCQGFNQGAAGNQTVTLPITFPAGQSIAFVTTLSQNSNQYGQFTYLSGTSSTVTCVRSNQDNANGVTPRIWAVGI